jgi:serine/threonine-protein kinase
VVAQAQPAGTERSRGDTVQLNVSIGPEPAAATEVPDVVGRRLDQGRRTLEQAGFEVLALALDGEVRNESPIASQTPSAGASVPRGSLVLLYLGR